MIERLGFIQMRHHFKRPAVLHQVSAMPAHKNKLLSLFVARNSIMGIVWLRCDFAVARKTLFLNHENPQVNWCNKSIKEHWRNTLVSCLRPAIVKILTKKLYVLYNVPTIFSKRIIYSDIFDKESVYPLGIRGMNKIIMIITVGADWPYCYKKDEVCMPIHDNYPDWTGHYADTNIAFRFLRAYILIQSL